MVEPAAWNVLPHGPLEELSANLWRVRGSVKGFPLGRNMIIARTADGRLWIHNCVAVDDGVRGQIESLGTPTWLVVPGALHRLDARAYVGRYPGLQVTCPPGARAAVEQRVAVDVLYPSFQSLDGIGVELLDGTQQREGVWILTAEDGVTLVFNDVLFNAPHMKGVGGLILRLIGSSGSARVTPTARLFLVKDRSALRGHMLRLAERADLVRIVPGHEVLIEDDCAQVLRDVAQTL